MKQIERIQEMEQHLDKAQAAIKSLELAIEQYVNAQESIEKLKTYLSSKEWKKDFRDSEAGKLPDGLKCGVLSEDGIWNMLDDVNTLKMEMNQLSSDATKDE
jgi:hypothetical protein